MNRIIALFFVAFTSVFRQAKYILLLLLMVSILSSCSARSVKTVLSDGQGNFDPWNTARWSDWYDPANPGQLLYKFVIDCNVTFATGHSTLATAWTPVSSPNHESPEILFYFDTSSYGVVVNGNGTYIDARPAAYRPGGLPGHESITTLYNSPGSSDTRVGMDNGFYTNQPYNASKSPAVISNLKMYGFGKAISTHMDHRQPITFDNCEFRRNNFPAYIHGLCTISNSQIKENYTGIYVDRQADGCCFVNNEFRDNQYQQEHRRLYGDIQMDSASHNTIEDNEFQDTLALTTAGPYYRCAIKFYRNKGESDTVRQNPAGFNVIRGNSFTGYTIALDVASRQGDNAHDLAGEARDFAYYNLFENNTFTDCLFGIKINNSGNTIRGNTFADVNYPILLHDIFYSLTENTITNQPGTQVSHWLMNSEWYDHDFGDWHGYELFDRQTSINSGITETLKYIHIRTDGTPNIEPYSGTGTFVVADTQLVGAENRAHDISGDQVVNMLDLVILGQNWMRNDCNFDNSFCNGIDITGDGAVDTKDLGIIAGDWLCDNDMKNVYAPFGKNPLDIAVGDFWVESPGDEIAVIWNEVMSNIDGSGYYTVIIYDSNGIENNRCGIGTKYTSIVAGNFVDTISSYFDEDGTTSTITCLGDEIAAISSTPDANGFYPIYILSYSRKKPIATLLSTNTTPIKAIAAGNFDTSDSLKEVAYILTGSTTMNFIKPSNTSWSPSITVASDLTAIAGGDFDTNYAGDEIASISSSSSLIYYHRVGRNNYYKTSGASGGAVWSAIGAGNFNPATTIYEVAVASSVAANGIYKIYCYVPGTATSFKEINQDVLGVSVRALDGGTIPIGRTLGLYERALGFYSSNYGTYMSNWGENVVALPSAPQTTATPVFWLNSATADSTKQYLKVQPIVR